MILRGGGKSGRGGLSRRRVILLVAMLALIAAMFALKSMGVAGLNGAQMRDMDWNADGTVSQTEMLQGFHAVIVRERVEGKRVCRSYAWRRAPEDPIRVDCRVQLVPEAEAE
ncbi:EF-hand domain-containing protein [Luteimonas sp. RIT-PG2_3]